MLKKILIALSIIVGIVILAIAALFISSWASRPKTDKEFLSKLKGEVVFTRRNAEGISDIWKINANGTGETMLYHNDKDKTRTTFPYWSLDGSKIYFLMYDMATEKKEIYEVDTDGKNIRVVKNPDRTPLDTNQWSRGKDIRVFNGDIYIIKDGQEFRIFKHSGYYNQDYAAGSGASETSWGPDKKYIIFEVDGAIVVADKTGRLTKITNGNSPDWKY
ncbi:MAG: hypothetical protein US99_C0046G0002 [Candidatus Daviesbacteria bacterium GW2011_GWF2_38_6]|uniref:Dipeptidylpeptidase IV N-terminal domain-containing protein n=1 Tax=Candidatus Daviesbacteria bacterium GW2011_GWF2_38_6 TaxID=1618432 RepID=A0A0G0KEE4_9BACT|nr:MAG: hypothetical protein US99_C0046G0002 [Candidatus Daviesbacteria bacterium GW2011_GWF2_38_6]